MNIKLINEPDKTLTTIEQILLNRGIPQNEIKHYLNLSDEDINDYAGLDIKQLNNGLQAITRAVYEDVEGLVIVDSDCDGFSSAALLINYLYKLFPHWVTKRLSWIMHDSKQHGLSDHENYILKSNYKIIFCPDSASNDYQIHAELKQKGITVIVLDHHLAEKVSEDAIVINNQLSNYPNKELSGVGVTWQFCKFIDKYAKTQKADDLLDLVALGLCGDMMSLHSFETRYLITKGFKLKNIKNPFIEYMLDKNNFALNKGDYKTSYSDSACTNMGAAFFVVPYVNAITRSGTIEEKYLIFESMLEFEAFKKIPEIKRNKETGKMEYLVSQAVRVITNVKNRQTKAEKTGIEKLEKRIIDNKLDNNNFLLLLLEPGEIEPEIRGLLANKFTAKYQKPCIIATKNMRKSSSGEKTAAYEGSMRGYTKNGLTSFKDLLSGCPGILYVEGHDNAAGVGILADAVEDFIAEANRRMNTVSGEPLYRVDYYFKRIDEEAEQRILDISYLNDLWGQDVERAYIAINFKVTQSNFTIMKNNTLKIALNGNLSIIKFEGTDEDIDNFTTQGWKEIRAICKCANNEWNGEVNPQLILEDYEVIDSCTYIF